MRAIYGKSIVEGAPFGNKNAAGPRVKGLSISTNGSGIQSASFRHKGWETSYKVTPSSRQRLGRLIRKKSIVKIGGYTGIGGKVHDYEPASFWANRRSSGAI